MPLDLLDPKTKQPVTLPEDQALSAYRAGKVVFRKGAEIPVVNGDGDVGTLTEAEFAKAGDDIRIASPAEVRTAKRGTLENVGRGALAFGEGVVHGAIPFAEAGALAATKALGGEGAAQGLREHLNESEEDYAVPHGAGVIGGMVAPLLIPGGQAEGAAGIARAAGGIPRGIAALGKGAGELAEAVTGGKATSALGKIAQGAVKGAVSAGTEGAAYGALSAPTEAALGDHELTAEKVMAGATHEAIAWGTAGGLLGGVGGAVGATRDAAGRWLQQLAPKDIDALAAKQFGEAAPGIGERVKKAFANLSSLATGEDAGTIEKLVDRRHELAEAPAVRESAAREVRTQLDALLDSSRELADEARGPLKAEYVKTSVQRGNEEAVASAAQQSLATLKDDVAEMMAKSGQYGEKRLLQNTWEYAKGAEKQLARAIESGEDVNAKAFTILDDTKRAIGRWTKGLQAVERKADSLELLRGRATRDRYQTFYEDFRQGLENRELWGKAADDQAAINAAWSKQIDAHRVFDARLTTNVGRDPRNPWVDIRRVDPAKAEAYVSGLTNAKNDLVHTAIKNYVDSTQSLSEAIGASYELPAAKVAHVAKVGEAATAFGKTIDKAADSLQLVNQFEALKSAGAKSGAGEIAAVAGALGHPLIGAAGALVDAVANPARAIARLTALERLVNKIDVRVGSSVRGFFKAPAGGYRAIAEKATTATRQASRAVRLEGRRSEEKAFAEKVARVQQLSTSLEMATGKVAASLHGLDEDAPKTSIAIASQAARVTGFLASKIPPGMTDTKTVGVRKPADYVSDSERAQFMRYAEAANDPTTMLRDLERGTITSEQVEAVKTCYPKLYDQVRGEVIERMVSQKTDVPYGKRVALGVLFDAPTDATLDPEFLQAISGAHEADAKREQVHTGGPPAKELQIAGDFRTDFDAARRGEDK